MITRVVTNGCFDVLHVGHIRMLNYCKSLGDHLIVLINSDSSVKRQGKIGDRPINNQNDRVEMLLALKAVDQVIVFDEITPSRYIAELRPDIYVKGSDYQGVSFPEKDIVLSYGGRISYFNHTGHSTTKLMQSICSKYPQ